ncbi:contact-dependent growth inhibition system immunity protein [Pantoea sp. B65]|uniref:contact-dependent growth inhibition system immunity protein n=1 Tax=Pantoea sp. B65 TaxID=2813359 RepID=UPI0039B4AFDB
MITFRKLVGNINTTKDPGQQSSLEAWFESVLDVPVEGMAVEDLCRAVRQKICVDQLMPGILAVLAEDPLAGDLYDGELIAALATIKGDELQGHKKTFIKIKHLINRLEPQDINNDRKNDILKINQIAV